MATKKKILVVDDDESFGAMLREAFESNGFEVALCFDPLGGSAAINKFLPDLIILDIDMPAGGGRMLFRNVRTNAKFAACPVLVVSGTNAKDRVWASLGAPPDDKTWFMPKPVQIPQLLTAVANLTQPPPQA